MKIILNIATHGDEKIGLKVATIYFDIVSIVNKPKGYRLRKEIKNYKMICRGKVFASNGKNNFISEEDFYPILFGESNYKDYFGFSGKIKGINH